MSMIESGTLYTLEELLTLHELEAGFHEVLVEGRTDAAVLSWFVRKSNVDVEVYAISDRTIVKSNVVHECGYEYGERGKVLTASLLIDQHPSAKLTMTCVADADYGYSLESVTPMVECLLLTDYSDLLLYCFSPDVLGKFMRIALRAPDGIDPESVLQNIETALATLFILRWVLRHVPGQPRLVGRLERRLSITEGAVVADCRTLFRDSIDSSGAKESRSATPDALMGELVRLQDTLAGVATRKRINGHDFVRVLCFYISRMHPQLVREDRRWFKEPNVVQATLLTCLDHAALIDEPMFKALLRRVNSPP